MGSGPQHNPESSLVSQEDKKMEIKQDSNNIFFILFLFRLIINNDYACKNINDY